MTRRRHVKARLRKALERSVRSGHPWLYREALEAFDAEPGSVVSVLDARGRVLCRGLAESGAIAVRIFTTRDEPIDEALLARRIEDAFALRARVIPAETDAYRLLHGEGDQLPGVVWLMIGLVVIQIIAVYFWGVEPARRSLEGLDPKVA